MGDCVYEYRIWASSSGKEWLNPVGKAAAYWIGTGLEWRLYPKEIDDKAINC